MSDRLPKRKAEPSKRVEQARKAMKLAQAGLTRWEIAETLGLAPSTVASGISAALNEAQALIDDGTRHQMMSMEMSRLDALQSAQWDSAMLGDVRACEAVLKIMAHRAKLAGLDQPDTERGPVQAVIVAGDSDGYMAALRKIQAGGVSDG